MLMERVMSVERVSTGKDVRDICIRRSKEQMCSSYGGSAPGGEGIGRERGERRKEEGEEEEEGDILTSETITDSLRSSVRI